MATCMQSGVGVTTPGYGATAHVNPMIILRKAVLEGGGVQSGSVAAPLRKSARIRRLGSKGIRYGYLHAKWSWGDNPWLWRYSAGLVVASQILLRANFKVPPILVLKVPPILVLKVLPILVLKVPPILVLKVPLILVLKVTPILPPFGSNKSDWLIGYAYRLSHE